MTVLYDTNVLLDVKLLRQPHVANSAPALQLAQQRVRGVVATCQLPTLYYVLGGKSDSTTKRLNARKDVADLLSILEPVGLGERAVRISLRSPILDYEDALIHQAGLISRADVICTRNLADFTRSQIRVVDPPALLALTWSP